MKLRAFTHADTPSVAAIFRDAVRHLGTAAYTEAQLEAWTAFSLDTPRLRERMSSGITVVLEESRGELAAFGQLEPVDCIEFLYCAGRFARRLGSFAGGR